MVYLVMRESERRTEQQLLEVVGGCWRLLEVVLQTVGKSGEAGLRHEDITTCITVFGDDEP